MSVTAPVAPPSPLSAARALGPLVRGAAAESERAATPHPDVTAAFGASGLFRLAAPAAVGGDEADPATTMAVIEAVSEADGAAGWVLMIAIETTGLGLAWLDRDTAAGLVAERPEIMITGALNPLGVATPEPDGHRVSGRWPWASGCERSDWFWSQCTDPDGELLEVLVPRHQFTVDRTWDVAGLSGSGSHDVVMQDVEVGPAMTTRVRSGRPAHDGPLFRLPYYSRLAYNKVAVATGIARGALGHFEELAEAHQPRLAGAALRERPRAQLAVARAHALVGGARGFVADALGEEWESVCAGDRPTRRQRALVRLACSHAVASCVEAVGLLHEAAGSTTNHRSSPLGRCFRDVHVVPQHIMVAGYHIDTAGRVLLGLDPASPAF